MSEQQSQGANDRNARQVVTGVVSSNKADQMITVVVERQFKHPKYNKYIRRHNKVYAHDERNEAAVGDTVEIQEIRPLSKLKRWRLVNVTTKAVLPMGDVQ
ncbi:MAG: 30S ribosomal protein S17 [Planctomycetes bacterium]|nr:30S ribosomal protein S17 [Planctomycetota bacterium]